MLAIGSNREAHNHWQEADREVPVLFVSGINGRKIFLVGVHHDRFYITTTEFPPDYFAWVREEVIPPGECLVLRRSKSYDLSKPASRKEACRALLAMMRRISTRMY